MNGVFLISRKVFLEVSPFVSYASTAININSQPYPVIQAQSVACVPIPPVKIDIPHQVTQSLNNIQIEIVQYVAATHNRHLMDASAGFLIRKFCAPLKRNINSHIMS